MEIRFDYSQMNDIMRIIKDDGHRIIRQDSKEKYCIILEIRKDNYEAAAKKFSFFEKLEMTLI